MCIFTYILYGCGTLRINGVSIRFGGLASFFGLIGFVDLYSCSGLRSGSAINQFG